MNHDDLIDPWIGPGDKGFPQTLERMRASEIADRGWNVLAGDLPLPLAVLRRDELEHNLRWMQSFAQGQGVDLAPHGKTTMSPQLFHRQLDAGAWGLTFATVAQVVMGVAAGARRCLIANQIVDAADLSALAALRERHADLRVMFLVDTLEQVVLIDRWHKSRSSVAPFEVLLEIGVRGVRTGCREVDEAMQVAAAVNASPALRLVGVECYEGLGVTGRTEDDAPRTASLMNRVEEVALRCDAMKYFETAEVIVSAGGSAVFDLVAGRLKPSLLRPVRGLLRSGCYIAHDHGFYQRNVSSVNARLGCTDGLRSALEVWALVQSCPEPGLAILAAGKRDLSFDLDLPVPVWFARRGEAVPQPAPAAWRVSGLNDQHAYLRWDPESTDGPQVGDRVGLGISHPCTTFDKWRWMPIVDAQYRVCDAIVTHF
ncbi:amino acid deaminase [Piscinibacter terrae]|uniref:Amino acid deaminase n=1 Tax=Piscinibacter terrae TaxID=2496871 RepID=A0A3N7HMF4_9BURK|nr:amino acid deaminase [Albitalea terrae]RQP23357.1 amino acid deaminase [Albitalea terrae]